MAYEDPTGDPNLARKKPQQGQNPDAMFSGADLAGVGAPGGNIGGGAGTTNVVPPPNPGPMAPQATSQRPQTPAPAQPVAPAAPAAPTTAAGWEDVGYGNLVRNTATGQMVDRNHPIYTSALAAAPAAPVAAPTAPAAVAPNPGPVATPPPVAGPIATADQVTSTTAPVAAQAAPGAPTSVAQSFQQALINKLNPQAVSGDNPAIAPAIQANALAEQRGRELQQNALAEQAARSGTSMSGGNDALSRGILADSAQRQGQFAGSAVQHLQDQQDADLMAALGLGGQTLQTNAGRAQQESQFGRSLSEQARQADVDAELRRLGINTQGSLGQGDLALRGRLGDQQANLGLLGMLLSNDQFGRQLGQQGAQFGQSLDQSGLMGLLGLL